VLNLVAIIRWYRSPRLVRGRIRTDCEQPRAAEILAALKL